MTGIDDHSRFCVIAKAVLRATAWPVCQAFLDAMAVYGVPDEVLSDNGTVFTGRFIKPRPAEVLFERICRENGITQRLTKPASPTTTGKIERLHQSLQNELLNDHGPFESLDALQAALDAWRQEYNTDRPHQSLNMAFPASRFGSASSMLELRVPARQGTTSAHEPGPAPVVAAQAQAEPSRMALEADRLVPPSGNLWIGGQQVWLGPALAGKTITIWVDETTLHVLLDGTRLKTLPSRLGVTELARLAADGARPAGASPLPAGTGTAVEVERMVNGVGLVGLAGTQLNVGDELAGQRVTLRMDGTQMAVISHDGVLLRTIPCPVMPADRHRLRGARRAGGMPPPSARPIGRRSWSGPAAANQRARSRSVNVLSGAPFGYRYARKSDHAAARYEVVPHEAAIVAGLCRRYADEGIAIAELARWLGSTGVTTRTGKARWDRSTIWGMLPQPRLRRPGLLRQDQPRQRAGRAQPGRPAGRARYRHRLPQPAQRT